VPGKLTALTVVPGKLTALTVVPGKHYVTLLARQGKHIALKAALYFDRPESNVCF
jgi:hypothetical protein